jgi:cold shock CspA family protein
MRRRTPRPRRPAALVAETAEIEELPVQPDVEAPSPKLLRRAQATPLKSVLAPSLFRETGGPVRAVVKWFDGKSGKGALRVTGFSGDVALEAPMLAEAGIRRLYKDQEVEATVEHNGDRIRLVGIALPGRMATAAQSVLGSITGQVRRQPRQVTVEVKRDGLRQKQARAEAEQVLGTTGATGNPRRFTS